MVPKGRGLKSIHHGLAVPATLALPAMATPGLPVLWNSAPAPVLAGSGVEKTRKGSLHQVAPSPLHQASGLHDIHLLLGQNITLFSLEGPESHLNSISLYYVTQPSQHRASVIP